MNAEEIISLLDLVPLPAEGGFYRETYRSPLSLPDGDDPQGEPCVRSLSTSIFYLLTVDQHSAIHTLPGDELFHFYLGDPVEQLHLYPDGRDDIVFLGSDLGAGQRPQVLVPGGTWQGSRMLPGGQFALLGTTMAPGFEFSDYTPGDVADLLERYPNRSDLIEALI